MLDPAPETIVLIVLNLFHIVIWLHVRASSFRDAASLVEHFHHEDSVEHRLRLTFKTKLGCNNSR